jgi:hypothetical protein
LRTELFIFVRLEILFILWFFVIGRIVVVFVGRASWAARHANRR